MKSFKEYKNQNKSFVTSLQGYIENPICESVEELLIQHGADMDNVFHKMSLYNYRQRHGSFIHENYSDVSLSIEEQFAVRDFFILTANKYLESLYVEFCNENEIPLNEDLESIKGGVKSLVQKGKDALQNISDKAKESFDKLLEKFQAVKEFIEMVKKGAINTAKKLVEMFNNMMLSVGGNFMTLIKKLGGDEKECYEIFEKNVENAFKDEKNQKENVYESFGNALANNDDLVVLEGLFDKFKKKKEDKKGNEYDDAANAKPKSKIGMISKAFLDMLLQMAAYYAVTIVLPAVIGLLAGPFAAAIVAVVAKVAWASTTLWKQVKSMIETVKSAEYKAAPKWKKALRWSLFILSVAGSVVTIVTGVKDAWKIGEAIANNAISQVLPDEAVQKCMKSLNEFWKKLSGENAPGYDKLLAAENQTWSELSELGEKSKEGQEKFDKNNNNGEFNKSETNNFQHNEDIAGSEFRKATEEIANSDSIKGSRAMHKAIEQVTGQTDGVTASFIDGATVGKIGRTEYINDIVKQMNQNGFNLSASDIDISQLTNNALKAATDGQAGTVFQLVIKGDATQQMQDALRTAVNIVAQDNGMKAGFFHMFSKVVDSAAMTVTHALPLINGTIAPFAGLFPGKYFKEGGFRVRLSSKASKGKLYRVESQDDILEIPYTEFKQKYGDKNPSGVKDIETIIRNNRDELTKLKEELDKKEQRTREDKKLSKAIDKKLKTIEEGAETYKVLVVLGTLETKSKSKGEVKEAKEESNEKIALFTYNPMIMGFIDLAAGSSKGPRKHPYYVKGLFASLEFIPVDGGMTPDNIVKYFTELAKESIKANFNMVSDLPCVKQDKTWVENKDSIYKDKPRKDFGMFTNKEITEIVNSSDKITDYLGGEHHESSSNKTNERKRNQEEAQHHEENVARKIKAIENDEKLKDFIDNEAKTLKGEGKLINPDGTVNKDELERVYKPLERIEHNYLSGKKKKGFLTRLKEFLFGKSKDEEDQNKPEYDPKEFTKFANLLASVEQKYNDKKEKNESFEDEYEEHNLIYEANMEILENEFIQFIENEETFLESLNENNQIILED